MTSLISLDRTPDQTVGALMGKCHRSPFTGKINMNSSGFPDFSVVDLWTRNSMYGSLQDFMNDKYLFKPYPLGYRTWIYHYLYRTCKVLPDAEETAVIRYVLAERCIDAPIIGGRWSAMLCYVPVAFAACITGGMMVVMATLAASIFVYVVTLNANTPNAYRYDRIFSFPVRIGLTVFLLMWWLNNGMGGDIAYTAGGAIAVLFALIDIIMGDITSVMNYRFNCTYEVIRTLPNRCLICRRIGAADYEVSFGSRGLIDQDISGIGSWEKDMMLIADVNGLLVELRPMEYEDWNKLVDHFQRTNKPTAYVGLDIFSEECPCADEVVTGAAEMALLASKSRAEKKKLADVADANEDVVVQNL